MAVLFFCSANFSFNLHTYNMTKDKKEQWDGISRVSNDLYRKNFEKIFGKPRLTNENAEEFVHRKWKDPDNEEHR